MALISRDKIKFAAGMVRDKDGKNVATLEEALREMAECGCGIECKCLGALILPVHDDSAAKTGIVGFGALYLTSTDGGATVTVNQETLDKAAETIASYSA